MDKLSDVFTPALHPLYAVAGIGLLAIVAEIVHRVVPFYRRELLIEEASRLTPLDGLRGILCFGVLYHHAAIMHGFLRTRVWEETPSAFYVLLGQTSVAFFFCITAYLFWSRALKKQGDIPPFEFLRGRFFRVAPLYSFASIVALIFLRKQIHWSRHGRWIQLGKMSLMGLIKWSHIGTADINMANAGVTWTLQYEWVFYLALPALAMLIKAGNAWRIAFIALAVWVMVGLDSEMDVKMFFVVGIAAAHIARMPRTAKALRSVFVSIPLLALLILMPLAVPGGYGWLALLFTAIVFIPIAAGNSMFGILNLPGLRLMGMVSYSVYLLHGFFLFHSRPYLDSALKQSDTRYWMIVLAMAAVVLICCTITYRIIEWPMIQFEKRFRRR